MRGEQIRELGFFFTQKLPQIVKGAILGNAVYTRFGKYPNFGDQLPPVILRRYGFTPVYAQFEPRYSSRKAEIVSVGTVLQEVPRDFAGIVIGAGGDDCAYYLERALVLAVRGTLTLANIKSCKTLDSGIEIGDPGLLVPYVYPEDVERKWEMGIVPHFVDKSDEIIARWRGRFGNRVAIIDVQQTPSVVVKQIKSCKRVISSSLHGLITADAFGIPSAMFAIRKNITREMDFKYLDYYSSLGIDLAVHEATGDEDFECLRSLTSDKSSLVRPLQSSLHRLFTDLHRFVDQIRRDNRKGS